MKNYKLAIAIASLGVMALGGCGQEKDLSSAQVEKISKICGIPVEDLDKLNILRHSGHLSSGSELRWRKEHHTLSYRERCTLMRSDIVQHEEANSNATDDLTELLEDAAVLHTFF